MGRRGEARGDDDYGREKTMEMSLWTIFCFIFLRNLFFNLFQKA